MANILAGRDKELNKKGQDIEQLRKAREELQHNSHQDIVERVKQELCKIFTKNQISLIMGEKKKSSLDSGRDWPCVFVEVSFEFSVLE